MRLTKQEIEEIGDFVDALRDYINEETEKNRKLSKTIFSIMALMQGLEGVTMVDVQGVLSTTSQFAFDLFRRRRSGKAPDIDPSFYIS